MRKEDLKKHSGFPLWLVILVVTGISLLGFLPASHANEAPVITGQAELSTPEDTSLTVSLTDLMVSDPDNVYPTDFTLRVLEGSNYSISENMITPVLNFNGDLTVPIIVNDGLADSPVFNLIVTVTPVNDEPTDLALSNSSVDEKQPAGTKVGAFSTVDQDVGQSYVYSLVEGEGADDNSSFTIADDALLTAESFDSKTKAIYKIRVKTDDLNGGAYEKQFTITVTMTIILAWDANPVTDEAEGYRVYYKVDLAGERNLDSYNGQGLVLGEESGTTRVVDSGFEILVKDLPDPNALTVSCHLSGLDISKIYFFVVTAFSDKGVSLPSREVATDDTPPTIPTILWSSHLPVPSPCSSDKDVSFKWSPSTDPPSGPAPGSGLAGYSFVFDATPGTTPDTVPSLSGVTEITLYAPTDGYYWFHIRAVDKAGLEGANGSETEHYGPICIDTGPPSVVYGFIDFENSTLYVGYSESHMQNAALQVNYSFDNGLLVIGDALDVYGDGMVFSFLLEPTSLDKYLIYKMTITENVTDCAGNPLMPEQQTITMNDDDRDRMADEWERLWFGSPWQKDGTEDSDGDGVSDLDEYLNSVNHSEWGASRWTLNPLETDSDHDSIPDGYEIEQGLNPTDASDGSANYEAYANSVRTPVINLIPDSSTVEQAFYTGPTPSLSQGSLPVAWSLVRGPLGMGIDSITGEVFWPEPTVDVNPYPIIIRAENLAGWDEKAWQLTVVPYQITVYVSALDGDDGTGEGTLELPWKSIGFALSETQGSLSPMVTIRIAAGRYGENIVIPRSGVGLEGGWKTDFSERWDFVQNGLEPSSPYETILDGQSLGSVIVAGSDTAIDGFTITGGKATSGGGISGGDGLAVSNCRVFGNEADMGGGGIYLNSGTGTWLQTTSIEKCLFENNKAQLGGGIYATGGNPWSVVISGCTFRGNTADRGGGIYNFESSPSIQKSLFVGNTALGAEPGHSGGGIANESSSPEIVNCTFSENTAAEYGGGIENFAGSTPTLINSILWGNTAEVFGNEIYNDSESTAYISFCDIRGCGGS